MFNKFNKTALVIHILFTLGISLFSCRINAEAPSYKVIYVKGLATVRMGDEEWAAISQGAKLKPGQSIRVLEKSKIDVSLGQNFDWILDGLSHARIGLASPAVPAPENSFHFELTQGHFALMNTSTILTDLFTINLGIGQVELGKGIFSIISDGDKAVEIAAASGRACVKRTTQKQVCIDKPGSIIWEPEKRKFITYETSDSAKKIWTDNKWPVKEEKPKLTVARPTDGSFFTDASIYVAGSTTPGCKIMVNNTEFKVKQDGSFSGKISLFEGENKLVIDAISPSGTTQTVTRTISLDNTPPLLSVTQPASTFDPSMIGTCEGKRFRIQIFGITEPGVSLRVNSIDASRYIENDGTFMIQDFPIDRTAATLTIEVIDMMKQRSIQIFHIIPPMDMDNDGTADICDPCPNDPNC